MSHFFLGDERVDQELAPAHAFDADDVRMLGLDGLTHAEVPEGKVFKLSPV